MFEILIFIIDVWTFFTVSRILRIRETEGVNVFLIWIYVNIFTTKKCLTENEIALLVEDDSVGIPRNSGTVKFIYNHPRKRTLMVKQMKIRQTSMHFADNTDIDGSDKFHKVRAIFNNLNLSSHGVSKLSKYLCVDESMVLCYGNSNSKQFILGEPIRYG